jgi:hypothetical protein
MDGGNHRIDGSTFPLFIGAIVNRYRCSTSGQKQKEECDDQKDHHTPLLLKL